MQNSMAMRERKINMYPKPVSLSHSHTHTTETTNPDPVPLVYLFLPRMADTHTHTHTHTDTHTYTPTHTHTHKVMATVSFGTAPIFCSPHKLNLSPAETFYVCVCERSREGGSSSMSAFEPNPWYSNLVNIHTGEGIGNTHN